ncbi:oligosaccharide flippase family protein [Pseudomonas matsuisoli]|uniref:oligosaccharide flippase family protein n=1 Tax=Pseudomonas matsuisoli TaxID=1515666 RepID=UPI001664A6FC|nr:oligosaccharide flippase family protein [Pseudomonas matsuisoli]
MNKLNELSKIVFVVIPMALQPVLNFILLVLVARFSPQEAYGALAFGMVMMTILTNFSDMGLRDYLLSKGAIKEGLSSGENLFHPSLLGFALLASGIFLYASSAGVTPIALQLIVALLPEAVAFAILQRSLFFHYQTKDRLVSFSSLDSIFKSMPFVVKIALFWITGELLLSVAVGSLLALALYAGWFYVKCVRNGGFFAEGQRFADALNKMLSRWPHWLPFTLSFLSFFLYFGFDRLLIEHILGAEPLAVYAAACSFIAIGQIVVQGFWSLYMPKISRGELEHAQRKFVMFSFGISLAMVIGYQLFAGYLFDLFYPETYAYAARLLSIMSLFFVFRLVNVVFEMYWVARGRYTAFVRIRIACGLLSVALNYVFINTHGLLAPAVILVLCEMLITLYILMAELKDDSTRPLAAAP